MKHQLRASENSIILDNVRDFVPKHIFECGQCFRWDKEMDGSYTGVVKNHILNVAKFNTEIIFKNTNIKEYEDIWFDYFDLNTDYSCIKNMLVSNDDVMKVATEFGSGIRILKQDPWETIASFIISANNNIPRIKKAITLLSEKYGEFIGKYNGKSYYSFPKPEILMKLKHDDLLACNLGYRGSYIIETARVVASNPLLLQDIGQGSTVECHKKLLQLKGVGPKVANCIAFFSFGKLDAFPVDVWIKRLMEYFYFTKETPPKEIETFAQSIYGDLAGYAQQYLFYYGRELDIGKGDKNVRDNR